MIYFKLFRVNNWIKNTFIFTPLFFSSQLLNENKFLTTLIVSIGFSLVTSFIYILNDIFDLDFDRNHLSKRNRPIASGKISVKKSLIIGVFTLLVGLLIISQVSLNALFITLLYVFLNIGYSTILKHIPIIDFVIVSFGFILRLLIGSEVGDVFLSQWMIVMVFLLSLFIAVSKRRDDVYQYENENRINRKVVNMYTVEYMDKLITIISSALIICYLLFITSEEVAQRYPSDKLIFTFIFVLLGVFRYNLITYVHNKSGSPIKILFNDRFLQIILACWGLLFLYVIYSNKF